MEAIKSKRCSRCRQEQPVSEFYVDHRAGRGYIPHCKSCHRRIGKQLRSRGIVSTQFDGTRTEWIVGKEFGMWEPLSFAHYHAAYGDCWECRCKGCGSVYVVHGRGLRSGHSRQCRSCGNVNGGINRRGQPGESAFNEVVKNYARNARKRGIDFGLAQSDLRLLFSMSCTYCGSEPSNIQNAEGGAFIYTGIDRVDSSIGYTRENCVPCCKVCNVAKATMSVSEFLAWVERVFAHQRRR
jgi:hypothetical protein